MCASYFDLLLYLDGYGIGLPECLVTRSRRWLAAAYGKAVQGSECRQSFCRGDGNAIELTCALGGDAQIHVRIDVDAEIFTFLKEVSALARLLKCKLYSTELQGVIEPVPRHLVHSLMRSNAWRATWGQWDPQGASPELGMRMQPRRIDVAALGVGTSMAFTIPLPSEVQPRSV